MAKVRTISYIIQETHYHLTMIIPLFMLEEISCGKAKRIMPKEEYYDVGLILLDHGSTPYYLSYSHNNIQLRNAYIFLKICSKGNFSLLSFSSALLLLIEIGKNLHKRVYNSE